MTITSITNLGVIADNRSGSTSQVHRKVRPSSGLPCQDASFCNWRQSERLSISIKAQLDDPIASSDVILVTIPVRSRNYGHWCMNRRKRAR